MNHQEWLDQNARDAAAWEAGDKAKAEDPGRDPIHRDWLQEAAIAYEMSTVAFNGLSEEEEKAAKQYQLDAIAAALIGVGVELRVLNDREGAI